MKKMKWLRRWSAASGLLLLAGLFFSGCQTGPQSDPRFEEVPGMAGPGTASATSSATGTSEDGTIVLKPNDAIKINYFDTPSLIPPFEGRVKSDGTITLVFNKTFVASGKTIRQLADEIRKAYVPSMFKTLNVNIEYSETARFFFVDGEVKQPGQKVYLVDTTVLKAITSAGGFTDFAAKGRVKLTRAGKVTSVNCRKALTHPELDLKVYPGDRIWVPRSIL